jgi:hypothetical protein
MSFPATTDDAAMPPLPTMLLSLSAEEVALRELRARTLRDALLQLHRDVLLPFLPLVDGIIASNDAAKAATQN